MIDVYIKTKNKGRYVRTIVYKKGSIHVALDFNREREIIGVEILDADEVRVNGERVPERKYRKHAR